MRYFIERAAGRHRLFRPEVMVAVPTGVTTVEQRAVMDAGISAGAKRVHLIPEPLAAAIGANVPISHASGSMVVNLGGGTTEIAVISLNDIVAGCSGSLRVGGNRLDEAIRTYIKRKYNLMTGDRTRKRSRCASAAPSCWNRRKPWRCAGATRCRGCREP